MRLFVEDNSCAGRSEFFVRAKPERSEGGWSEVVKNREGVASGSATFFHTATGALIAG